MGKKKRVRIDKKFVAKQLGYYGNKRIRPGQVFFVRYEDEVSKKWMKPYDEKRIREELDDSLVIPVEEVVEEKSETQSDQEVI